ncbi:hypothetical protein AAHA92_27648 [Salvia divinorum]|uniref:Uncharacterized protein n=1 Tax=Salvia divinorum TaxID=28513 RepID=A0ABD1G4C4_SALDI
MGFLPEKEDKYQQCKGVTYTSQLRYLFHSFLIYSNKFFMFINGFNQISSSQEHVCNLQAVERMHVAANIVCRQGTPLRSRNITSHL